MADYTISKSALGAITDPGADESAWQRVEPLISAAQLRVKHLFGIPLVSAMKDPLTGKAMVMTDEIVKDFIIEAVTLAEAEANISIFPVQYNEKHDFDKQLYESFGFFRVKRRPVSSVESINITPANGMDVYTIPLDWVETSGLAAGQINISPLTMSSSNAGTPIQVSTTGGAVFMSVFHNMQWMPGFWRINYTAGYVDGAVPRLINQYIGCVAAMEILSMLASTYARSNSTSVGIDGMSQSVGGPGGQIFAQRLQELQIKRKMLLGKIKAQTGGKLFSSNV